MTTISLYFKDVGDQPTQESLLGLRLLEETLKKNIAVRLADIGMRGQIDLSSDSHYNLGRVDKLGDATNREESGYIAFSRSDFSLKDKWLSKHDERVLRSCILQSLENTIAEAKQDPLLSAVLPPDFEDKIVLFDQATKNDARPIRLTLDDALNENTKTRGLDLEGYSFY